MSNLKHGILSLPDEILDKILLYFTYDEISRLRVVCKGMDVIARRLLTQGFLKVERYHARCLRDVKAQLPRRESERRKHPLAVHCDILTAIETRLSLLGMTFMKYVDMNCCCFIPGKVVDEIYKVLRYIMRVNTPPRAHEILQELRDISSMAMEYFDERIAPAFKQAVGTSGPKVSVSQLHADFTYPAGTSQASSPSQTVIRIGSRTDFVKFHLYLKQMNVSHMAMKKDLSDLKSKMVSQRKKTKEQEKIIDDQKKVVLEQGARLIEQDKKINEVNRKLLEYDRYFSSIMTDLNQLKDEKLKFFPPPSTTAKVLSLIEGSHNAIPNETYSCYKQIKIENDYFDDSDDVQLHQKRSHDGNICQLTKRKKMECDNLSSDIF